MAQLQSRVGFRKLRHHLLPKAAGQFGERCILRLPCQGKPCPTCCKVVWQHEASSRADLVGLQNTHTVASERQLKLRYTKPGAANPGTLGFCQTRRGKADSWRTVA